jgi:hypothetical protein
MSDIYTYVGGGMGIASYACHGRKTRAEAIKEARSMYERQREEADEFLALSDEQFRVIVQRGYHRPKTIEVLNP